MKSTKFWIVIGVFGLAALVFLPLLPVPWGKAPWAPSPEEWQAYAAMLGIVLATLAAGAALVQLYSHLSAVDDSRRPYVIADFHFRGGGRAFVEISNISTNPAYEVRLSVDHPFELPSTEGRDTINKHFSSPESTSDYKLALLAPGRRLLYPMGGVPEIHSEKLQKEYKVTISYFDQPLDQESEMNAPRRFLRKERRHWVEPSPLDLAQWSSTTAERDEYHWKYNESPKYLKALAKLATTQQLLLAHAIEMAEKDARAKVPPRKISTNHRRGSRR